MRQKKKIGTFFERYRYKIMHRLIFIFFLVSFHLVGAQDYTGAWSGILMKSGQSIDNGDVIYFQIDGSGTLSGLSRVELHENEKEFAAKSFNGTQKGNKITIKEEMVRRSSKTRLSPECKLEYELTYNENTGYLKGKFTSSDCKNIAGVVVLFRSDHDVNIEKEPASTHLWKKRFSRNYKKGYPAPKILEQEQADFKFETIHFDFDKAEVRPEYYDYLNRMARVLDAVHDLRVRITGHTDGEGSDYYNLDLSERRADALRDYFKKRGVEPEKLEIDFKGKRQPIGSNQTKEGRQINRRVVFEFEHTN